jgi:hypothetical protein
VRDSVGRTKLRANSTSPFALDPVSFEANRTAGFWQCQAATDSKDAIRHYEKALTHLEARSS